MKYILVDWPEIQDYMNHPDYPKDSYYDSNKGVWFIPETWVFNEDFDNNNCWDNEKI